MNTVGNVAGPLLAYEVLTAFFLEATFLGIMLFGRGRVSEGVHTLATWLVALGTTASAFWILALNSWMHTPAGFEMINGQAHVTSWFEVIFNPSFPYRMTHMLMASGLTGSFLIGRYQRLPLAEKRPRQRRDGRAAHRCDGGRSTDTCANCGGRFARSEHLEIPTRQAGGDGRYLGDTARVSLRCCLPFLTKATQSNKYEIAIPKLASFYLTHDWNGEVKGIKEFGDQHPPVGPVFWAFRIMVGMWAC